MAYIGKYIDRNPCTRAAGIPSNAEITAAETLKIYHVEERAEDIIRGKCAHLESVKKHQSLPASPIIPKSTFTDFLSGDIRKTRFEAFKERFQENMYFRKSELGKPMVLHSKPDEITNENTLFGEIVKTSEPLYDLILPKKNRIDIDKEYFDFHKKKIISHKHYFPSEQIDRNYNKSSYDSNALFGKPTTVDKTGILVQKCLTDCDRLVIVTLPQKKFIDRSLGRLGKPIKRQNYHLASDYTYGRPPKVGECHVQALLENISPCVNSSKLVDAIAHVNQLRRKIFMNDDVHIYDVRHSLKNLDTQDKGRIPLRVIFDELRSMLIRFDEAKLMTALNHFELICNENCKDQEVDYEEFAKILTIQIPLPKPGKLFQMPKNIYNKDTTYRLLCQDLTKIPEYKDLPYMGTKVARKKCDTRVGELVPPSIMVRFGLEQLHFDKKRSKAELEMIFQNIIESFEAVWQATKERLNSTDDMISVTNIWDQIKLMNVSFIYEDDQLKENGN